MNTDRTQFTSRYCLKCRPSDTEFLADCQKILAGSGYWLRKRARNENRKQFENAAEGYYLGRLWQSMPLSMASYYGLYVEKIGRDYCPHRWGTEESNVWHRERVASESRAVGMVLAVARIYELHGKPIAPDLNMEGTP